MSQRSGRRRYCWTAEYCGSSPRLLGLAYAPSVVSPLGHSGLTLSQVEGLVRELIEIDASASPFRSGRFNDCFLLSGEGQEWVLRASPREDLFPVLRLERGMLQRESIMAVRHPGLIPEAVAYAHLPGPGNRGILLRRRLAGIPGDVYLGVHPEAASTLWADLRSAVRKISGEASPRGRFGFAHSEKSTWCEFLHEICEFLTADLTDFGQDPTPGLEMQSIVGRFEPLLAQEPARLCHGDLWPKNVLVDERARLLTIVDWERSFYGPPSSQMIPSQNNMGATLFSIDSAEERPVREVRSSAVYQGMVCLQRLAESVRNPTDTISARQYIESLYERSLYL